MTTTRVLNVDRATYDRLRVGCELLQATTDQRRRLTEFVSRNADEPTGAADPVEQRRAS